MDGYWSIHFDENGGLNLKPIHNFPLTKRWHCEHSLYSSKLIKHSFCAFLTKVNET